MRSFRNLRIDCDVLTAADRRRVVARDFPVGGGDGHYSVSAGALVIDLFASDRPPCRAAKTGSFHKCLLHLTIPLTDWTKNFFQVQSILKTVSSISLLANRIGTFGIKMELYRKFHYFCSKKLYSPPGQSLNHYSRGVNLLWGESISPFSAITPAVWKEVRFSSVAAAAPTPRSTSTRGRCAAIRWCCCCPDLSSCSPHGGFQGGLLLVSRDLLFRGGLPDGPFVFPRPASVHLPIRPSGSSRGFDLAPDGGSHLTATAATCVPAIRSSRTVCRICCWRVTTRWRRSLAAPACRDDHAVSELFHCFVACTSICAQSAKAMSFTPTNSLLSTCCRPSCAKRGAQFGHEFTDCSVMLEIKMMLQPTDLSQVEIAYRLRFRPVLLGRFFLASTGNRPPSSQQQK